MAFIVDTGFTTESGNDSRPIGFSNNSFESSAQGFQTTENLICPQIRVMLKKTGAPPDNIEFRIETNAGIDPSGTLVNVNATKSTAASGISTSFTWYTFVFPATFALTTGTPYHLVARRSGGFDNTKYIAWRQLAAGGYPNGTARHLNAAWVADGTRDYLFEIYKEAADENAIFFGCNF